MSPPPTARERLAATRVYVVVTPEVHGPGWETALEEVLATGLAGMVQLREKTLPDEALAERARHLGARCREHGALFLLNDRVHLVEACEADGVHVGQADVPCEEARARLGRDAIVGLSTHDEAEVAAAARRGADYAGLGPCFPTASKNLDRAPGGPELVHRCMARAGGLPVFPIGGITPENVALLVGAGARRVAVGAGILAARDPAGAIRRLHGRLLEAS